LEKEREQTILQIAELRKGDPFSDPDHASDNAAVDTDVREQVGHETVEAEIKDLEKRLEYIGVALKRMKKGDYGVCEKCNDSIPTARLDLIPEALYCIECEKKLRK